MESTNKTAYRFFCSEEKALPIFFKDWYLDSVCIAGEWDVALVHKEGKIIAAMPWFLKRNMGFSYITMPPFVKWMGPYIKEEYRVLKEEQPILETLIQQLPKVDGFKQNFHYSIQNWLPFYWANFKQSSRYTYILHVADLDLVYSGINRNMRRNIKKAKAKLQLRNSDDIEQFYRINKMSFDRQNIPIPYSLEQLKKHDQALAKNNARQIFFAEDEKGQIHSAAYLIWDGTTSYYHLSGDHPELRQSGGGILLIWEAIQFTKNELGLNRFDFEGSMLKSVEQIRRQFGAKQQPYFYIWKYYSKWYQFVDFIKK